MRDVAVRVITALLGKAHPLPSRAIAILISQLSDDKVLVLSFSMSASDIYPKLLQFSDVPIVLRGSVYLLKLAMWGELRV